MSFTKDDICKLVRKVLSLAPSGVTDVTIIRRTSGIANEVRCTNTQTLMQAQVEYCLTMKESSQCGNLMHYVYYIGCFSHLSHKAIRDKKQDKCGFGNTRNNYLILIG